MSIKSPVSVSSTSASPIHPELVADGGLLALEQGKNKLFSHLPFLDGLRALSIFAVLTFHSGGSLGVYCFKNGGWAGVDVFFVISGFLITAILLKERDKSGSVSLKNFYARRALRLMPVYYLWIIVTVVRKIAEHKFVPGAAAVSAVYMTDYDMALGWGAVIGSGFEVAWSLSVEEKFYLLWPSVVKAFRKSLLPIGIAAIVACFAWRSYLICTGAPWIRICGAFDTKLDAIMIGCVAATLMNNVQVEFWFKKYLRSGWAALALLLGIVFFMRAMGHPNGAHTVQQQLIYWNVRVPCFTLAVAALIVSLCSSPQGIAARILSCAPVAWIGRISYSLYLWHIAGFAFAIWFGMKCGLLTSIDRELLQYGWSIAFAAISYYLIETPFLKLKERFSFKANTGRSDEKLSNQRDLVGTTTT
jgi:peptidoglycan/LPS O-acetylase OafA/YrhL